LFSDSLVFRKMKKSFTLIEMILALGILAAIVITFVLSTVQFSMMNEISDNSLLALNAASSRIEEIKGYASDNVMFTSANTSIVCGTEAFGARFNPSIGRLATLTVYLTCKKAGSDCTNNIFDLRVPVCWKQTGDLQVGRLATNNLDCVSSPVEVKASLAVN